MEGIRLSGGRNPLEGSVEVKISGNLDWTPVCGEGWNLPTASVVCRVAHNAFAQAALESTFPLPDYYAGQDGNALLSVPLARIECRGHERSLSECHVSLLSSGHHHTCQATAGVICTYGKLLSK